MARKETLDLPEVNFSDEGPIRHLHLDSIWIQGSMLVDAPMVLVHEYIQRMMAWLLFVDPGSVAKRQALQLGLGAGSLTKFCHKVLRMKTTAIELNPQVVAACRGWFKLPQDDNRLQVVLADAEQEIKQPHWLGAVDALQVDLYDQEAAGPGARQRRVLCRLPQGADRRRLHDGQPVWPLIQLPAQRGQHGQPPLARMRCGPSRPRARATRWCWPSARPCAPSARC